VTKREEFREAQEQVQAMQQEHYVAQQRQSQDIQRFRTKALQEEHGKLVSVLPDWAEPEKQKKIVSEIRSYASGQGFSDEELNSLVDHRSLLVLMKAQKYDKLQKADIKSKKLKNKPRVIRAGAGKDKKEDSNRSAKQKMKRLRHTGHVDDAASLLEDMFNS
jgi:2,3-bisphosphoglycerate-independent phosphoglycerate mutase